MFPRCRRRCEMSPLLQSPSDHLFYFDVSDTKYLLSRDRHAAAYALLRAMAWKTHTLDANDAPNTRQALEISCFAIHSGHHAHRTIRTAAQATGRNAARTH